MLALTDADACILIRRHARPARPPQALASEKLANRTDPPRAPWPQARRHKEQKVATLGAKTLQSEQMARAKSLIEMAGATGLKPATFGVTGRTKCNGIDDSWKFFSD